MGTIRFLSLRQIDWYKKIGSPAFSSLLILIFYVAKNDQNYTWEMYHIPLKVAPYTLGNWTWLVSEIIFYYGLEKPKTKIVWFVQILKYSNNI